MAAYIASPMHWKKSNSSLAKVILSQNYSTTFEKLPALMISRFNTVLPSKPRGKLGLEELF
jgi:hypothetical protein